MRKGILILSILILSTIVYSYLVYEEQLIHLSFNIVNTNIENIININNIVFIETKNITINTSNTKILYYSSYYSGLYNFNVTENVTLVFNLTPAYLEFLNETPSGQWKNITVIIWNGSTYMQNIIKEVAWLTTSTNISNPVIVVYLQKGDYNLWIYFGVQGFIPPSEVLPLFTINGTVIDYAIITNQ